VFILADALRLVAFAATIVCHCMFDGASAPPHARSMRYRHVANGT